MLRHWDARTLADLLVEHGLDTVVEEPFPHDGWSGASLTLLRRGGDRFVLKRTSWAVDWIARATRDRALREGFVAANALFRGPLGGTLVAPYLGAAADGPSLVLLMPDLSTELVAWDRPAGAGGIDTGTLDRVLGGMAGLHVMPWAPAAAGESWPWCPLRERLLLLARPSAEQFRRDGLAVGERFLAGWDAFDRLAPRSAGDLVDRLSADPAPLLDALGRLPAVGLHGDLKLANVALLERDRIGLIDWQMTTLAPVAVELGWFLVSNVALLPLPPEAALAAYRDRLARHTEPWSGGPVGSPARTVEAVLGDWEAQVDLTWIVGLLLRGWRKGLDADAGLVLPSGATAGDDLVLWCSRAVAAAGRRL